MIALPVVVFFVILLGGWWDNYQWNRRVRAALADIAERGAK